MWPTLLFSLLVCFTGVTGGAVTCGGCGSARLSAGGGETVGGVLGRSATLECTALDLQHHTLSWVRSRDLQILSHGDVVFTADPRVSVSAGGGGEGSAEGGARLSWHRLHIANLRHSDAGRYECQLNTDPKISQSLFLTVQDEEAAAVDVSAEQLEYPVARAQGVSEAMQRDEAARSATGGGEGRGASAALLVLLLYCTL